MPNSFERSKMRTVCRYLADSLDRCSGSTLQQRWNDFENRFWLKWKAGINRPDRTHWTWGARVPISARMVVPSLDMLANVVVNQWIARLPEDHPLAQQHRALISAAAAMIWTSSSSRCLVSGWASWAVLSAVIGTVGFAQVSSKSANESGVPSAQVPARRILIFSRTRR